MIPTMQVPVTDALILVLMLLGVIWLLTIGDDDGGDW